MTSSYQIITPPLPPIHFSLLPGLIPLALISAAVAASGWKQWWSNLIYWNYQEGQQKSGFPLLIARTLWLKYSFSWYSFFFWFVSYLLFFFNLITSIPTIKTQICQMLFKFRSQLHLWWMCFSGLGQMPVKPGKNLALAGNQQVTHSDHEEVFPESVISLVESTN